MKWQYEIILILLHGDLGVQVYRPCITLVFGLKLAELVRLSMQASLVLHIHN